MRKVVFHDHVAEVSDDHCVCSSPACASHTLSHYLAVTQVFASTMPFKLQNLARTDIKNDKQRQSDAALQNCPAPPKQKKPKVTPTSRRLDVCIYKVTDQAGNCWHRFRGSVVPLWQVLACQ